MKNTIINLINIKPKKILNIKQNKITIRKNINYYYKSL